MPLLPVTLCMAKTVKAREHYGADSLDLTIPSDLVREHNVNPGDIFEIDYNINNDILTIEYKRVYSVDS